MRAGPPGPPRAIKPLIPSKYSGSACDNVPCVLPFAHIAGIPVEETLLGIAPIGAVGLGAFAFATRDRAARWRRRLRRRS